MDCGHGTLYTDEWYGCTKCYELVDKGELVKERQLRQAAEARVKELERFVTENVNALCSCGGCGPNDNEACKACLVYHGSHNLYKAEQAVIEAAKIWADNMHYDPEFSASDNLREVIEKLEALGKQNEKR